MRSINRLTSILITAAILTGCATALEGTSPPASAPTSRDVLTGAPPADNTPIPTMTPITVEEPTLEATIEPPTAAPEPIKTFNVCRTREEAANCPVSQADLDSGAFVNFIKTVDTTTFPTDVVFPPKLCLNGPPGVSDKRIFWEDVDGSDEALTAFYIANPDKLNQRIVAFGRAEWGGSPINIKIVKNLNPDGSVVYLQYISQVDSGSGAINNVSTWPGVEAKYVIPLYSDPTIVPLLRQWIDTGVVPIELEGKTLWENDEGDH